jgi:P pilus assembly chaperone PapD
MYKISSLALALRRRVSILLTLMIASATPALAAGDLLVAPTRVMFERAVRTSEVTLTNIGTEPATYRISLEVKRMTKDGRLEDVAAPTDADKLTQSMIRFAPRKIQLLPNQPQQVRLSLRKPEGLADGEYRVHMLFRAVPDEALEPIAPNAGDAQGISINLRPIYGISIPVIIRQGNLEATPSLGKIQKSKVEDQSVLAVDIARTGNKSVYGALKVWQAGNKKPVALLRGVAVYPEVSQRTILMPFDAKITGKVTVQYVMGGETEPERVVAETTAVLN